MEAHELRLGNWVHYNKDTLPATVDGIAEDVLVAGIWRHIKQLSPVELSPEILEKAGFVVPEFFDEDQIVKDYELVNERKCIYVASGKSAYDEGAYVYSGLGDPESYGFKTEIKYLHDLQNLYFALTGNELEINLNK